MVITDKAWSAYIAQLRKISNGAALAMLRWLERHPDYATTGRQAAIEAAYSLATHYGEAATALAAEMYDTLAAASHVSVPAAIPAETATIDEVAKAVAGTAKTGNSSIVADSVGRLVKLAGVDTTMQNALRDGAEWAWIPRGETCAFCLMLASNGWQRASKKAIRGGHAEHIHANCDCTYAVRFDSQTNVAGYDPDKYLRMFNQVDGSGWTGTDGLVNALQAELNARHREEYNARKREEYAARREKAGETYTPQKEG